MPEGYQLKPLAMWEEPLCFKVGPVCDPQDKARVLAMVPKNNNPNAKIYANLIKQVIAKWEAEYSNKNKGL